jgi:DNA-binding NarL/FixJ family response regulator
MIRIVIIEEHKRDVIIIKHILDSQDDFEIAGTGKDGYDALILTEREKPDIVLMACYLPMEDWGAAIALLKGKSPKTSAIILSPLYENESIYKAIRNGVSGCLAADTNPELFIAGIRTVYNGGSLISPELYAKAYSRYSFQIGGTKKHAAGLSPAGTNAITLPRNLTRIELKVIVCLGHGFSNREIAESVSLKEGTIRNHITSIFQKTGFRNRTQVGIYAFAMGLIDFKMELSRDGASYRVFGRNAMGKAPY